MRVLNRGDEGFALVEALAAFCVLALVLSVLLSGISQAGRNDARAEFLLMAARLAQSRMATIGVSEPIVLGSTDGRFDDNLYWEQFVEPMSAASAASLDWVRVYSVRIVVRTNPDMINAGPPFVLNSIKVVHVDGRL